MSAKTLLDVVKYCNNHSPLGKDSGFLQLTTAATTAEGSFDETHVGFVPDFVRLELIRLGLMSPSPSQARREMHEKAGPHRTILIQASDSLIVWEKHEVNQAQRSRNFRRMILELKAKTQVPAIKHVLDGWRDEEYAIYDKERDLTSDKRERKVLCHVERAACALFGFATFGVHCTVSVAVHELLSADHMFMILFNVSGLHRRLQSLGSSTVQDETNVRCFLFLTNAEF